MAHYEHMIGGGGALLARRSIFRLIFLRPKVMTWSRWAAARRHSHHTHSFSRERAGRGGSCPTGRGAGGCRGVFSETFLFPLPQRPQPNPTLSRTTDSEGAEREQASRARRAQLVASGNKGMPLLCLAPAVPPSSSSVRSRQIFVATNSLFYFLFFRTEQCQRKPHERFAKTEAPLA